jgi:hypothetical protein
MPLTYVCDTCGKSSLTFPPSTWTHLTTQLQRAVVPPEQLAPPETTTLYVCDDHDASGIWLVLHEALGALPPAKPPR